ncbi:MAG: bifunctional riboflavin kinase/FAD synthetase [Rhodospirillales bacterium]|jgi:riboflavin kinase/FMN adenylyltransferase|nr:bifunctional riboflavin kinase/FAD synthetase [Rhodospirillales bacterium]HJN23063.1 bifunctional riboflavin kinase/FAD synthetase [Rhodospirillales bacterium]
MRIFRHFESLPAEARGAAVAIGNFDGVHRGHQAVIAEAGHIALAAEVPLAVLTFEPHPREFFRPGTEPFRLTPFRTKAHQIEELGVDHMIVLHFDDKFSLLAATDFVHKVLVEGLGVHHVVSGYDFVFGHRRQGDCELLLHMGREQGFGYSCVKAVENGDGRVYSSTAVRNCLKTANPQAAARMLDRDYEIEGRVEKGTRRGHSVGFPTANMHLGEYMRPANGVYAVRAGIDKGRDTIWLDGAANLGQRPTFPETDVILEVHLFDFDGDLYGRHLRVRLVDYLRAEKKFDGLDDLKAQIAEDCARALEILTGQ